MRTIWEEWFAWYPVETVNRDGENGVSWLTTVERRRNPETGKWDYRDFYELETWNNP